MNASIFWKNFTCMDFAYIDKEGMVKGNSLHVSATVTGKVTEDEDVVIDFSKGKKQLKGLIDGPIGFDHKLIIFKKSGCEVEFTTKLIDDKTDYNIAFVKSKHCYITCPTDAVVFVNASDFASLEVFMSVFLSKHLSNELNYDVKVDIELSQKGFDNKGTYFNYIHGLKNSTSFGCKNQNHGHRSFVEVDNKKFKFPMIQTLIAEYLNDKILINKENVIEETNEFIRIGYTCSRGLFTSTYYKPHEWIVFDSETTIEHMINYVSNKFRDDLKGCDLYLSEGLSKGALIKC